MTPKEKEQQLKEWNERNRHVLHAQLEARKIVSGFIEKGASKADVILMIELMMDLAKRFD